MAENATTEQTAQVQQPAPTSPKAQPAERPAAQAQTTTRPRIPRPHCAC